MIAMFNNQLVVSLSSLYFTEKKKKGYEFH